MSSEAPEKIWASCDSWSATWSALDAGPDRMSDVEYRLASSVDALLAERDAEIDTLRSELRKLAEEYRRVRLYGCNGSARLEWNEETIGYYFWSQAMAAVEQKP